MTMLSTAVVTPPLREPNVSLLQAANNPLAGGDETNGRWVSGIEFQPLDATTDPGWAADACTIGVLPTPAAPPGVVAWQPYVIGVDDMCSTIGFRGHRFKERLDAKLKVARHKQVEKEFWGGALAQANGYPNAWLTGPGVTDLSPASAPSMKRGIEILEQGLADCGLGGRGMIHVRPEAVPYLTQVRRVGNLILTVRDTIVVVGTGYLNTGPGGASAGTANTWMFATGMVDVRLDTDNVNYFTLDASGRASQTNAFTDDELIMNINRANNTVTTRAEMFALASWDEQCWLACKAALDT